MCKVLIPLLALFIVSGCSSAQQTSHIPETGSVYPSGLSAPSGAVKDKLYQQYRSWKGAPYELGGLNKAGVDCSGFVYLTFRDALGQRIPRTTKQQSVTGKQIARSELRTGDLVFFKTGYKVRHVGIYLESGKFLHASTKRGVMVSDLNGYYWKDKYWHARRMAQ